MKNTAFTDILFNWESMPVHKKIQRMQDFENMLARLQGRKPRKVSNKPNQEVLKTIGADRLPEAYYCRSDKEHLYIFDLSIPAIDVLKDIIHEGFHAYIHDFITGAVKNLRIYSQMDPEIFYIQEENLPAIHDELLKRDFMPLFDSFYVEEKVNYSENSIYLVKFILDSIESVQDAIKLQEAFIMSLAYHADNTIRGKNFERTYNTNFDNLVVEALNKDYEEKVEVDRSGKISTQVEPELHDFVMKACDKYKDFSNLVHGKSIIMTEAGRQLAMDQKLAEMVIMYRNYVMAMLKAKKKN